EDWIRNMEKENRGAVALDWKNAGAQAQAKAADAWSRELPVPTVAADSTSVENVNRVAPDNFQWSCSPLPIYVIFCGKGLDASGHCTTPSVSKNFTYHDRRNAGVAPESIMSTSQQRGQGKTPIMDGMTTVSGSEKEM
ncbi:hypothetical protein HAX54_005362, partial [Datura stramonium]|nr:hypothetical protein [Datura stramonium]